MKTIYAIPGLGTTAELFDKIKIAGHELKVLEWPVPAPNMSMKDYAIEMAKQISATQPVSLLGVSFGGMLVCELVDLLSVEKVVLVSSCKTSNELPSFFNILRKLPANKLFSEKTFRALAAHSRLVIGFEKKDMPEYLRMVHSMPAHYFDRCFNMIVKWRRTANRQEILHVHGTADRLLGYSNIRKCETIKNGNHAMIIYKAPEINAILNNYFNGL